MRKAHKRIYALLTLGLMALTAAACTAGPSDLVNTPNEEGEVAGFWQGLWHGFIAPFTFIISLFKDTVHVFEVHNNGNWYMFGFLMGASIIFGGGGGGAMSRKCR